MTEKTLTTENIKPALDALRGELAPWPVVALKQDRLNAAQLNAANSGITSSLVAQIIANTAAIRALESAITGTGLRALVVASLPAVGTTGILYIVPVTTYDPDTDADVVNYSNEYIWIPVEGGQASEGHYEQVGQTGIVINNGQLNITVNGTSVGTFTANQSGDTTAAITVPTNADYVDRTTDQTVAGVKTFSSTINGIASKAIADEDGTSIKTGYVNVAGNQTVTGNKDWTGINSFAGLTIKDSVALANGDYGQALTYRDNQGNRHGYIQPYKNTSGVVNLTIGVDSGGSVQLNSSLIPYVTNAISLGSSSYQWPSVYAKSYYYNGAQWGLDQPNTWSNINNFQREITLVGDRNAYVAPMWAGVGSGIAFLTQDASKSFYWGSYTNDANNRKVLDTTKGSLKVYAGETNSETIVVVEPTNATNSQLGTSTNKWKTLNGVNPGALSFPDLDNTIDITSTFNSAIDKTQNLNSYTADFTGWLQVLWWTQSLPGPFHIYFYCTNSASDSDLRNMVWGQVFSMPNAAWYIPTVIPVISGKTYWFETSFTRTSTDTKTLAYSVRKLPCLGNV